MNKQDEILIILQEECAEVIQAISKIKRFGMINNSENLKKEIADLLCMIDILRSTNILSFSDNELNDLKYEKVLKLKKFSGIFN